MVLASVFDTAKKAQELKSAAYLRMDEIEAVERVFLVERRLASRLLAAEPKHRGAVVGEGTKVIGDFYQISNATALGRAEATIVDEVGAAVTALVNREMDGRRDLLRATLLRKKFKGA